MTDDSPARHPKSGAVPAPLGTCDRLHYMHYEPHQQDSHVDVDGGCVNWKPLPPDPPQTDDDLLSPDEVTGIATGLADVAAGRTRPFSEIKAELKEDAVPAPGEAARTFGCRPQCKWHNPNIEAVACVACHAADVEEINHLRAARAGGGRRG